MVNSRDGLCVILGGLSPDPAIVLSYLATAHAPLRESLPSSTAGGFVQHACASSAGPNGVPRPTGEVLLCLIGEKNF